MVSRIAGGGHKSGIKPPPAPHLLDLLIRQVMGDAHYLPQPPLPEVPVAGRSGMDGGARG
jgi:hypothetical protein